MPTCSTRAWFITAIWSATSIASSWSCVTKIVVTCISSWRWRSQSRSSARTRASSAPNGSSSSSTFGRGRERAGERHPLPLAAGELGRVAVAEVLQLDEPQELVDASRDLGRGRLRTFSPNATLSRTVMCLNAA